MRLAASKARREELCPEENDVVRIVAAGGGRDMARRRQRNHAD